VNCRISLEARRIRFFGDFSEKICAIIFSVIGVKGGDSSGMGEDVEGFRLELWGADGG